MEAKDKRDEEITGLLSDVEENISGTKQTPCYVSKPTSKSKWTLLLSILAVSLLVNVFFAERLLFHRSSPEQPSKYASLSRDIEEPYVKITKYATANDTYMPQIWNDIDVDNGVVALSDEWAAKHGLRTAQRFPWDRSKGVYVLHGYHNLHCVKEIHISLDEHRSGRPQSREWHHIAHCLDSLRRQVMCDADDTPRATDRRKETVAGLGQHRQCRSWDALERFAKQHTACYRRPEAPDGKPIIERYKFCPPGSGYVVNEDYQPTDELQIGLPEESVEDDES